jgi:hypothetical protein
MPDLAERLGRALADADSPPWLPELTEDLVSSGWQALYHKCGLSPGSYSTDRVMTRNVNAPHICVALLSLLPNNQDENKTIKIDILGESSVKQYEDAGIRFYTEDEIRGGDLMRCVGEALTIMERIPSVAATVVALVRSLHMIKPEHNDYDVSFSEPDVPFSIFVSIPQANDPVNVLRVAEAILHEAMHLQLTLIEKIVPLVTATQNMYFSPWRGEYRNAQGIIHALYVFRVIDEFLKRLPINSYSNEEGEYVKNRRAEIHTQIREIRSFHDCSDLTGEGSNFVRGLVLG